MQEMTSAVPVHRSNSRIGTASLLLAAIALPFSFGDYAGVTLLLGLPAVLLGGAALLDRERRRFHGALGLIVALMAVGAVFGLRMYSVPISDRLGAAAASQR